LDEATTYTFFGWAKILQNQRKLVTQCNHRTEYPRRSRYFAQRRVLTSMTVHMERSTPPTRMLRVSMFPGNPRRCHDGQLGCFD
jgi:hypothetical protein